MKILGHVLATTCLTFIYTGGAYSQPVDYDFEVKGVVRSLPSSDKEPREIMIKHEPIPDYRDDNGKVVGMNAMTMPFYLDEAVRLDGITVGDAVIMDVQVKTKPVFKERVISISRPNVP